MPRQNIELLSIINKMISVTTEAEIQNFLIDLTLTMRKSSFAEMVENYLGLILGIGFTILVLAVALFYSVAKILNLIFYDYLTGLKNRRCVDSKMKDLCYQASINDKNFSAVLLDLDLFKSINDTYGHDCGDEVLKTVANAIKKNLGKKDYAYRWGGEEFLVLIGGEKQIAVDFAETVRKQIENQKIQYNGKSVGVTLTAGVTGFEKGMSEKDIFIQADENLYRGKQNGRNQVVS